MSFLSELKVAGRSLARVPGLAVTVILTLALGVGANAAIFSVFRAVLLRPLVNRDEDRLIYIRQLAPAIGAENMTWSVPEIDDFKSRITSVSAFGDFSTVDFALGGPGRGGAWGGCGGSVAPGGGAPAWPGASSATRVAAARTPLARPCSPTDSGP